MGIQMQTAECLEAFSSRQCCACSPSAATCLVNNLDLVVQASGLAGYTLYGNGQPDVVNNVERVRHDTLCLQVLLIRKELMASGSLRWRCERQRSCILSQMLHKCGASAS